MVLHELLIALTITAAVLAATYATLEQGLRTYAIGATRVETQQAARAALVRLAHEIREAGFGADVDMPLPALAIAEPSRVVLASDLDFDGATSGRGEQITWQLVSSVLRRNGGTGAGAQPVSNGVRAFSLRYFNEDGVETTDVDAVRIVEIAVVSVHAGSQSSLAQGVTTQFGTRVRLRNR